MNAVATQTIAPPRKWAPAKPVVISPDPSPEQALLLELIKLTKDGRRTGGEAWNGFSGCTTGLLALLL